MLNQAKVSFVSRTPWQVSRHSLNILTGRLLFFTQEEVDAGAIIAQEAVPVVAGDTEESLSERIREAEHQAFPTAMELVASGAVRLEADGHISWKLKSQA